MRREISVTRRRCMAGLSTQCIADYERIETSAEQRGVDRCLYEPELLQLRGIQSEHGGGGIDPVGTLEASVLAAERCGRDMTKFVSLRQLAHQLALRGDASGGRTQARRGRRDARPSRPPALARRVHVGESRAGDDRDWTTARGRAPAITEAVAIQKTLTRALPEEIAQLYGIQSATLFELGAYEEAAALQTRALEIRREQLGPRHPIVAFALANLAVSTTDSARARELNREAVEIFEANIDAHPVPLANSLVHAAGYETEAGEYKRARATIERALSLFDEFAGADYPFIGDALVEQALILLRLGELDDALDAAERGHAQLLRTRGENDPTTLGAVARLSDVHRARGETTEAHRLGCSARDRFIDLFGTDHPLTAQFAAKCREEAGA